MSDGRFSHEETATDRGGIPPFEWTSSVDSQEGTGPQIASTRWWNSITRRFMLPRKPRWKPTPR